MKLYTEDQVKQAIELALNGINQYYTPIIDRLIPIELPSKEEIEKAANDNVWCESEVEFYEGAKWVIEQIKQKADGHT